jgi:hypothetical protein
MNRDNGIEFVNDTFSSPTHATVLLKENKHLQTHAFLAILYENNNPTFFNL